ncbi:uncharacterized protein LOC122872861 isoform X2 [Siniperca chuatsi]|uniref:uncharacterized protein LOC122872861 isoform X2 n=1 Tax=Siniperca chuatsi TaxID=119488 RepID=UPI001CE04FFD|nr:uncharacterized protein LOC122872861 isoform X2 [Siniperca chuatsi]
MQRYWWPGYEIQLLRELQRQQNNAQFCDTLLQTEGISVPTHSCILAALSPYLSQKLSASPSPPSGQKRQLHLQAVKAQTLLKLVRLLYSGELEVIGSVEQNDVLSAARQFGITDLLEGQKDGGMKEGELQEKSFGSCRERNESRKMQDAQVLAEMPGRRDTDSPIEKRSCVSTGTQTVKAGEKTVCRSFTHSGQTKPPTPEPGSSVAPSLDFFMSSQPQNITLEKNVCSTSFPPVPSMPSGAPSDGESTLDGSSDSVTDPKSTSALSSNVMTFPISLNDNSNSPTPREEFEFGDSIQVLAKEGTGLEGGKMADNRENREQPSHANRDEVLGEEKGNSTEKRHAHANVGMKSLAKMKQMQRMVETTQISIKVKLRRRTKGEVWEVVSVKDTDETSVLTSRKQDVSNHKRPQVDLTNGEPPPSSVQPGPIHEPILQPATTNSPEPAPHPITTSDSQLLSSDCFTPNQNDGLESVPLPQPPGPVEESDEQIEKLLEDIMMGLNILPNLERDCKKSHHLQPSHDGAPATCQVLVTEKDGPQNQMHAAVSAAECAYYQDFGTQIGHSSTDTAPNQPSCSSLSSVQPDAVLSQRQCSPQCHSAVTSVGQTDGTSHQGMPLSKSQNCPYPEAPTARSDIPTACYSSGQKLHYPACQETSSQDDQSILEFLPLTNGNEAQASLSFSLPCMDDLRLPRLLSPLEPSTSAAKHQPILSNSANHSDKILPSLHGRPWLTEVPASLQFPLSAITHRENKRASLPQDANCSCWSRQRQKHLELNPQNGASWVESCTVEERGTISAGHQNAAELNSHPMKVKESSNCKQGDAAAPKRRKIKRTSHPQDAAGSLFAWKDVKVSDGQINLSVCSVSLSSNNVLAKEREMATSSLTMPYKFVRKPSESSAITESLREKTRGPGDLSSDQTRIRTRGFLKKTRETPSDTSLENSSVLKPVARTAKIVYKQEVSLPRRKRGRPPKVKLENNPPESSPAITEKKSHNVESEHQIDNNLPKEECEKSKRRCKKQRRNRSEVEVIPPKKTTSAESTGEAEPDNNNETIPAGRKLGTPKRPRVVILKEFQKLIKHQHSRTRKSKESQDKEKNETARDVEEELTKETEMDIDVTQSQNRDGIEESHVIFNVTVDKNHNEIFNKSQLDDSNSSTSKETSLFGDEDHPLFSFDVLGEEVAKLAAEREQPLKNPDEARKACDAGVSNTGGYVVHSSRLCCDTHLPQNDKMPLDHNLNPQTPEGTGPPLSDTVGFSTSSGCDQEGGEEEVEVDVLLYSPDKVPQISECENGLDMDINPEEEEEEDVNEIDVTGDEAE